MKELEQDPHVSSVPPSNIYSVSGSDAKWREVAYLRVLGLLHAVVQLRRALAHFVTEQEAKASHQRVGSLIHWRRGAKLLTYFPWWDDGAMEREAGREWELDGAPILRLHRQQQTTLSGRTWRVHLLLARCQRYDRRMPAEKKGFRHVANSIEKNKNVMWRNGEGLCSSVLYKQVGYSVCLRGGEVAVGLP